MERALKHPGAKSVGWALVQAARLHRSRMGDKLGELGLFAGQEQVLQALSATGLMTMGELANVLRVRPPTASKTVSRLAALHLVERHAEPDDARIVRVKLTKEGQQKAAAIEAFGTMSRPSFLGGFDSKDRKRLRKLLRESPRTSPKPRAPTRAASIGGGGYRRDRRGRRARPRSSVGISPARAVLSAQATIRPSRPHWRENRTQDLSREFVAELGREPEGASAATPATFER